MVIMSNLLSIVPIDEIFRNDINVLRAGVIPYTIINNEIYWLMGKSNTGRLGDFGGGCKSSKKETAYQCLIREVQEESSGILTGAIYEAIQRKEGVIVWASRSRKDPPLFRYLLLVPMPFSNIYMKNFKPNPEVQYLCWIRQKDVLNPNVDLDVFLTSIHQYIKHFRKIKS